MISKTKQDIGHLVTMAFSNRIYKDGEMDIRNATWRRHSCFTDRNKIPSIKIARLQQLGQFHPNQLLLNVLPRFFSGANS